MRITKSFIDKAAIPETGSSGKSSQAFYRDSVIAGFGLRVTSGGAKSFIIEKRVDGRVKRKTLVRYGNLPVEQVRKEAQKFLGKVATGIDPIREVQEKRAKRITLGVLSITVLISAASKTNLFLNSNSHQLFIERYSITRIVGPVNDIGATVCYPI